ncbi:MAG: hypothetical protein HGA38_02705 [Candidatus Moranbacteria bacterium]|nr:hypothetical protein [Candidatus Moranbacteria bacterium]
MIGISVLPEPSRDLGLFLKVLLSECSFLERTGRPCAYFGFSSKSDFRIKPVVFRIGQPKFVEFDAHLIGYAKVKLHALYENQHFLTTYDMDGQDLHSHGVFVLGGGLSLPSNYVSVAAFPREWDEAMAYLFGCYLEASALGIPTREWLSEPFETNFGLFQDSRVSELVAERGVLAKVLSVMREKF